MNYYILNSSVLISNMMNISSYNPCEPKLSGVLSNFKNVKGS